MKSHENMCIQELMGWEGVERKRKERSIRVVASGIKRGTSTAERKQGPFLMIKNTFKLLKKENVRCDNYLQWARDLKGPLGSHIEGKSCLGGTCKKKNERVREGGRSCGSFHEQTADGKGGTGRTRSLLATEDAGNLGMRPKGRKNAG